MKIVIVTPLIPPELGEPAEYVWELAKRLALAQHDVTVVAYAHASVPIPRVRVVLVEKHRGTLARLYACMQTLLKEAVHADVIYAQKAGIAGLPAVYVSKKLGIPLVVHFPHSEAWERSAKQSNESEFDATSYTHADAYTTLIGWVERFVLRRTPCIVAHSVLHADFFSTYYSLPRTRFVVIPPPQQPRLVLPLPPTPNPHRVVFMVSIVDPATVERIARVDTEIRRTLPTLETILVYRYPSEHIEVVTHSHLRLVSRPSSAEVQCLVEHSGALVLLDSTLSHVPHIVSYLSMGVPTLAPTGSTPTNIFPPEVIRSFDNKDDSSLTALLTSLLTDQSLPTQQIIATKLLLETSHAWTAHLKLLEAEFTKQP
jgi:glycosyltransferase involved in cell wall biosynthesis